MYNMIPGAAGDGNARESSGSSASAEKKSSEGASGGNKDGKASNEQVSDFVSCHYCHL